MTRNPRVNCFFWAAASTSVLLGLCGASENASASVYQNAGTRTEEEIKVCFVGDALTTQPSRVKKFQEYMSHYQYAANVVFNFTGTCPKPTPGAGGNEFYDGDIRIVIKMTDKGNEAFKYSYTDGNGNRFDTPVPGKGCNESNPSSNWSNFPSDLSTFRACLYNLKIGDEPDAANPYLNNILHEVGHALGLSHEHQRIDVDRTCVEVDKWCKDPKNGGCGTSSGLLTPYDRDSVMHYQEKTCNIEGNYGYAGLSLWDQLGVHILYPEDQQVAEFVGTTVIRTGDALSLESAWEFRGANIDTVASKFVWKLNTTTVSTTPELSEVISTPGTYQLKIDHKDFLGRSYSYSGPVRVLTKQDFIRQIAAPIPSQLPLF